MRKWLVLLIVMAAAALNVSAQSNVQFQLPKDPISVGSYYKVPVNIALNSGLTMDQLDFVVPRGAEAGKVSLSRDRDYDPQRPDVMLLAGYKPGRYILQAVKKNTTTIVGQGVFETTAKPLSKTAGPSVWFEGAQKGYSEGRAWGGGPTGPQNSNVFPASGTRRMAIILVDSASERYPTDPAQVDAIRKLWKDAAQDGLTASNGKTKSVAHYFREVSYGKFDVVADVYGPYHFDQTWEQIFGPMATFNFMQLTITASNPDVNYNNYDTVVGVMKSYTTANPPILGVWPNASIGTWGPYTTEQGSKNFGVIAMPDDWGANGNEMAIASTLAHELGHNLGMGDLYTPNVSGRNLGAWDLMHAEGCFPHISLVQRMKLGWVDSASVQTFNFATANAAVDQTVMLNPIELGTPPAGRKNGIEVRIADGWNYYFEYRKSQAAQIGEECLPTDNRILGTDAISPPYLAPIARPENLLLNNDSDGDGPVLGNGQNYRETDRTNPSFPVEMRADASGVTGTAANLRIRYGVIGRPDPSIRPWAPDPWQSPDIEVRNERNAMDPAWFNVPWDDHDNTVVAKVKNSGDLDAPNVVVHFYVKDANIGGAPETFIGSDTKNIPAGSTVEFNANWRVPREGHYCVIVRIPLYVAPSMPPVPEMTELNNLAQSNYDRFISRTASPPSREVTFVEIRNPFSEPTYMAISASQNDGGNAQNHPPYYRTYLEHTWLLLEAGESRRIKVMFEGTGALGTQTDNRIQNSVKIVGYAFDPKQKRLNKVNVIGGWQAQIDQARAVRFTDFSTQGLEVSGRLETVDNRQPVTRGRVIISQMVNGSSKEQYTTVQVDSNGRFRGVLPSNWESVNAYYLPPVGLGDAISQRLLRKISLNTKQR